MRQKHLLRILNVLHRFALILIQASATHALLLQRIDRNPGILPIKEGQALISNDKWIVIKVLDISLIHADLEFNINRYANLNKHITNYFGKKPLSSDINDLKIQTDYIKNITSEKIKQLVPSKRSKRGILNPLGAIVKIISGNLDNDDAIRYDALISNVKDKQIAIDKKITVVAEMMSSLVNITNTTRYNFIQLDKAIWDIRKQLNETDHAQNILKISNVYNLFLHNFQMLYSRLDEIETIIAFSKLGMLHQAIFDTNELLIMLKGVEQYNKLIFPVNLENLLKLEQTIELKAFSKENQITFIMSIPLVETDTYTYYRVLPLPITNTLNQTQLILPQFPYLLTKGLKTVSLLRPCREVDESLFLCEEDYASLLLEDKCVTNLISFTENVTLCQPTLIELDDPKVEKIQTDRWMIYSKSILTLSQNCNNEITHHHIQGTYILTIDDDCKSTIKGVTLQRRHQGDIEKFALPALPIITLPEMPPLSTKTHSAKPVNLNGVDLTNLQHLTNLLMKSESVNSKENKYESVISVKDMSIGTLILYIILAIVTLYYIKKYLYRNSRFQQNPTDNFEVAEGEVMHPGTRHDIVTIQTNC